MTNMILSAFSDEYATAFEEQLLGMQRFGISHIELRHADGKNVSELTEEEGNKIKEQLARFGIRVSAIGSPLGKIPLDGDMSAHLESAARLFRLANSLDAKYVRVFSFYPPKGEGDRDRKAETLKKMEALLSLADKYGVTLCHENEAGIYGDTPARCRELLTHFSGRLRCVFDMGNFVLEGEEPFAAYEALRDYISYFHIKDAKKEGAVVPAGLGDARIKDILEAHRAYTEQDFFVSLEPHLQTFSGLNALVGRTFDNPYKYENEAAAFTDAVEKFRRLV